MTMHEVIAILRSGVPKTFEGEDVSAVLDAINGGYCKFVPKDCVLKYHGTEVQIVLTSTGRNLQIPAGAIESARRLQHKPTHEILLCDVEP